MANSLRDSKSCRLHFSAPYVLLPGFRIPGDSILMYVRKSRPGNIPVIATEAFGVDRLSGFCEHGH